MVEKLFEKIDDNPGEYFSMLVESVEDKKESLKEDSEYKTLAKLSNGLEVISYPYGYAVSDGYVADRFVVRDGKYIFDDGRFRLSDKDKQKILNLINKGVVEESLKEDKTKRLLILNKKTGNYLRDGNGNAVQFDSEEKANKFINSECKNNVDKYKVVPLKEDKFIPKDKMSKKAQKELNDKKRGTWGNTNPVTRVQSNKKAYDRRRDKKADLDESKELKEDFDIKLNKYEKDSNIKDGYTFNFIVNGHPVSMSCWTEDLGDGEYGDFIVDFDDYSQLDFISEDELDDLWEKLGDIIETKVLKNESLKESVLNESSDGWDESKLYDLSEILDEIYNLQYEVQNTVRGAYTNAHTYEELGYYVHNLGSNLMDIGDEIMEMEEEDEEDED